MLDKCGNLVSCFFLPWPLFFVWQGVNNMILTVMCVCFSEILQELDEAYEKHRQEIDPAQRRRLLHCIQRALIRTQELGDEKIEIAGQMVELVENRAKQVEWHVELFQSSQAGSPEPNTPTGSASAVTTVTMTPTAMSSSKPSVDKRREETPVPGDKPGSGKRSRRQKNGGENRENSNYSTDHGEEVVTGTPKEKRAKTSSSSSSSSKKKKRSKAKQEREASPTDLPIDPNEPTYCLCEQVSYGEMIGCDNDECPIEWFHFSCVGLHHKPKGKWYCPKCRGENEKTMDKSLERSKKERSYNR